MSIKDMNRYGYSRESYKKCEKLIWDTNLRHAGILNFWFGALNLVFIIVSLTETFGPLVGETIAYVIYFAVSLVCGILILVKKDMPRILMRIIIGADVLMLAAFGIYSSVSQPYMAATMILVLLVVVSLSFIDTFLIAICLGILTSVLFVYTSFVYKPLSIIYFDLYNVIIFGLLALILHYSFQRTRIAHFITFNENIEIQRDLSVRSSFDALTSILNRGSFFSLAEEILRGTHDEYIVLGLFDLDKFKQINDVLGHQMGDKAIQIATENIMKGFSIDFGDKWDFQERAMKQSLSFAGRLGGDEFIVFLRGRKNRLEVEAEMAQILEALSQVEAGELKGIHSSVGVVEIAPTDRDLDRAYTMADIALYSSKEGGRGRITFAKKDGGAGI